MLWFGLPGDFKMVSFLVTGIQTNGGFCRLTHSLVPAVKILFSHRQTLLDYLHHSLPLKLHALQLLPHFLAVFLTFPRFIRHILAMWHMEQWCLLTALNSAFMFSFNQQKPLCKNNRIWYPQILLTFESAGECNQVGTSMKSIPSFCADPGQWLPWCITQVMESCLSFCPSFLQLKTAYTFSKLTWTCLATGYSC